MDVTFNLNSLFVKPDEEKSKRCFNMLFFILIRALL